MVAAGIFLSRIAGFVRTRAMAHYLGNSDAADAFTYALKLPNLLQNLFGEGVLSASFIPIYVKLLEEKRHDEARRVAGAVASLLFLAVSVAVLLGVLAAPLIVQCSPPGTPASSARCAFASSASCSPAAACWCCAPGASAC